MTALSEQTIYHWSHFPGAKPLVTLDEGNKVVWKATALAMHGYFHEFVQYLQSNQVMPPRYFPDGTSLTEKDAKKCCCAVSGDIYPPHSHRAKDTLLGKTLFILDIDNKNPNSQLSLAAAIQHLQSLDYRCVVYTSWSHSDETNKFRIIFFLDRVFTAKHLWENFYEWALDVTGLRPWALAIDAETVLKISQVYFFGHSWLHPTFITAKDGTDLPVPEDSVLEQIQVPERPWANTSGSDEFTGDEWFRNYPDIDFSTLDLEGVMLHMGIKVGRMTAIPGGSKFRCHCPWPAEHTRAADGDDAYITERDGKWPTFRCGHSNHGDLSLADICAWAGIEVLRKFAQQRQRLVIPESGWLSFS